MIPATKKNLMVNGTTLLQLKVGKRFIVVKNVVVKKDIERKI